MIDIVDSGMWILIFRNTTMQITGGMTMPRKRPDGETVRVDLLG
jgi:hypothetical protein